ncbi:MAG TPA: choice-of-anchor D domain-containing protein [Verrucomicrobiae bacterium]|nr:choice-of-anchor D domain-containing protein [Verrucomicrobiae bacterium]
MNAGGRADSSSGRRTGLSVFLLAALTATTGHGASVDSGSASIAPARPETGSPDAPRPQFVVTTEVTVESSADFEVAGARTVHRLVLPRPPYAEGRLELTADGAYGSTIDRASASAEGVIDAEAAGVGTDCVPALGSTVIPAGDLEHITADGVLTVTVHNTDSVLPRCAANRHTVLLRYDAVAGRLEFPPARVGSRTGLAVTVHNTSDKRPLSLTVTSDRPAFAPEAGPFVVAPGEARTIALRFAPATAGAQTGRLTIDAGGGSLPTTLELAGTALDPAAFALDPGDLTVSLPVGGNTTRSLQVTNLSPASVDLVAMVEGRPGNPGAPPECASPAAYVLEGITNVLARVDLQTGAVTHLGPEIFGASAIALTADGAAAFVATFSGELDRLDTATGARTLLAQGLDPMQDDALSPDGATLFLLHRDQGTIETYDVASGARSTLASGLAFPTRFDLDPSGAKLYVQTTPGLTVIDVATGTTETVFTELKGASSPRFDADTGLIFFIGSPNAVRSFDPATHAVQLVTILTDGFVPFAIAENGRLAYGLDESAPLLSSVDFVSGLITPLTSDLTSVRDIALRADADCLGTFLTVTPTTFTLPAGGSAALAARFSALGARPGDRAAAILVREAGQQAVLATTTAALHVASAPHLTVEGAQQVVEQVQTTRVPTGHFSTVTFTLPIAVPPTGAGTLDVTTEAALHNATTVSVDGTSVGSDDNPQCVRTTRSHEVPTSLLAGAAADGTVTVRLALGDLQDFGAPCGPERFTARLTYAGRPDTVAFGPVPTGASATQSCRLRNTGDQPLHVQAIETLGAGFSVADSPLTLLPGGSASLPVTFTATTAGPASGTLRFETNDVENAALEIALSAQANDPAACTAVPPAIDAEAVVGGSAAVTLTLSNGGEAPMDYSLDVTGSDPACPAEKLVSSRLETIDLATLAQGTLGTIPFNGYKYVIAADAGGRTGFVAFGSAAGGVSEVNLTTGSNGIARGLPGALGAAFEPGGDALLFTDAGQRLYRFDRRTGALDQVGTEAIGGHVAVHPGGATAYITHASGMLRAYDLATGALTVITASLTKPQGIVLSPDATTAYIVEVRAGNPDGDRLVKVDLANGVITPILAGLQGGEELALDPSGTTAYLSEERALRVIAVNLATGQPTILAQPNRASGLAVIPRAGCSGRFVSVPARFGTIAPGSSADLPLTLQGAGLATGTYTATLTIRTNDPLHPATIVPITFDVLGDTDADGAPDLHDNCPVVANPDQADGDHDARGDVCDNCPVTANDDQADSNNDGAGDACQPAVSFLALLQDGGPFVIVRLGLGDPLGLPLTGEVAFFDAAAGPAPARTASGEAATAPRLPGVGRSPGGVTTVPAGATPVLSIPWSGRPPRRVDLAPLLPGHPYRLRVSAGNGTTIPFVAETTFQHQAEGTLAFNEPPVARIAGAPALECDRVGGALAALTGGGSGDGDSTPGTNDDIAAYAWTLDAGAPGARALGTATAVEAVVPVGVHRVTLRVTDQIGESGESTVPLTITDTAPPVVTLTTEPAILFPPNHELVPVTVRFVAMDVCDGAIPASFTGATSSEPDDAPGGGDGATTGDIGTPIGQGSQGPAQALVLPLRAERSANGSGRVYEVRARGTDAAGNAAPAIATIVVPHDLGHGPEPLLLQVEPDAASGTRIYWPSLSPVAAYDVIAGDLAAWRVEDRTLRLGPVRVLARGTSATSFVDAAPAPPRGSVIVYLVQVHAAGIVTGYGTESAPWPRVPATCEGGCP